MQVADIAQPERESNFVSDTIAETDYNVRVEYFDEFVGKRQVGEQECSEAEGFGISAYYFQHDLTLRAARNSF